MLYSLGDGRARTSTELAILAEVSPSTGSAHLHRLLGLRLVKVIGQGKHRYYSLAGRDVADALEALSVVAGAQCRPFVPSTPSPLRAARTCYDHIAGALGVALHERFRALGWLCAVRRRKAYDLTPAGEKGLAGMGVDLAAARSWRRRFAYACLDWSERRPHLAGALGAALLNLAVKRRWVVQELDSRALEITRAGQRELLARLGIRL